MGKLTGQLPEAGSLLVLAFDNFLIFYQPVFWSLLPQIPGREVLLPLIYKAFFFKLIEQYAIILSMEGENTLLV